MANVGIDSDSATIPSINLTEQGSNPATPAASHWQLFMKSDGLYIKSSAGVVTKIPLAAGSQGPGALLERYVVPSDTAGYTLTGFPATYTDLLVEFFGRTSDAGTPRIGAQFNADAANHYRLQRLFGTDSATTGNYGDGTDYVEFGLMMPSGENAALACYGRLYIPQYRNTGWYKTVLGQASTPKATSTADVRLEGGAWLSTAAITAIKVISTTGNVLAGSIITLWGID